MSNEVRILKSQPYSTHALAREDAHADGMILVEPSSQLARDVAVRSSQQAGGLYCPFRSGINANANLAHVASVEWARRMGLASTPKQHARLEAAKIAWLEAFVLHTASLESLQLAADWTVLFCMLDDLVEEQRLGPIHLSAYLSELLAVFRKPNEIATDSMTRALADVSRRMRALGGESSVDRFARHLDELFGAYVWEEINRWKHLRPGCDVYQAMREITIGLRPQFVLAEIAEGIQLSAKHRECPELMRLEWLTCRAVGWANDIFTHEKELEQGEMHNLVLVLMDAESKSLCSAVERAKALHDKEIRMFLATEARLAGVDDPNVRRYVSMLRRWVRGHLDWAVTTGRYQERQERTMAST